MKYQRCEQHGACIDLPTDMQLAGTFPSLMAASTDGEFSIWVGVHVDPQFWDAAKELIGGPLPDGPEYECRLVGGGEVSKPYPGEQIIFETIVDSIVKWSWHLACEAGDVRIVILIQGDGLFADCKDEWQRVVESLRISPEPN